MRTTSHPNILSNSRLRMSLLMFHADLLGFALSGLLLFFIDTRVKLFIFQWDDLKYLAIPTLCLFMFAFTRLYPGLGLNPADEIRLVFMCNITSFFICILLFELAESKFRLNVLALLPLGICSIVLILLLRWSTRIISVNAGLWGMPVAVLSRGKYVGDLSRYFLHRRRLGYIPAVAITDSAGNKAIKDSIPSIDMHKLFTPAPHPTLDNIDTILVDMSFFGGKIGRYSYTKLSEKFQNIIFVSDMTWLEGAALNIRDFEGLTGIEAKHLRLNPIKSTLKRMIDIVGSLFGILFLTPFMLVLALVIKLDSPGPVFYLHQRISGKERRKKKRRGKHLHMINIYKLRTMHLNPDQALTDYLAKNPQARKEWSKTHKLRNDPRITRIGSWLRKFSIDELPQLLNVLKGEMSLVGPRPLPEYHHFALSLVSQDIRTTVKPGMTGMWQVSGRSNIGNAGLESLDVYYVRNWSIWLDIYILARTPWVVLVRDGAY